MKKTSKTIKNLMFLSFMVLVTFVGLNMYQKFINNPKKLFIDALNGINNEYLEFHELKNDDYGFASGNFTYDGNIDINLTSSLLDYVDLNQEYDEMLNFIDIINNLKIHYSFLKNDNQLLFNVNNNLEDKNLDFSYYIDNGNHYIKLNSFDDNYIKINKLIDNWQKYLINVTDKKYLIDLFLSSFEDNLSDDYFNTTKEEIKINDEKLKVIKNSLILDRKNITTILNKLISDIKNDEIAYNMIIQLYPSFAEFNIDILDNLENDIEIYFNIYTDNNKLVKCELEFDNLDDFFNLNMNNICISFSKLNNTLELLINKKKIANINFYSKENGYQYDLYLNDSKLLTFDFNHNEMTKVISLTSGFFQNNSFNLNISQILDKNILEDYDKLENKLVADFNLLGFNLLKLEIKNVSNIYDTENINVSVNDSLNFSDLSDYELEKIKSIFVEFFNEQENE